MTNWEKFKEVFGIPADSELEAEREICPILDCTSIEWCAECPVDKLHLNDADFWEREYKGEK